jgi:hypothetical protein
MKQVIVYDRNYKDKEIVFTSENEEELKIVFNTLIDYHRYDYTSNVVIEEIKEPEFKTLKDFLNVYEFKYHYDLLKAEDKI